MRYPIVIHKDKNSDYGVTVPDLPGCFSAGETLDEAMELAHEAVECHIEGLLLDGEPLPAVHPIEYHQRNADYADGVWALVEIDLSKLEDTTERVNITISRRVLTLIDEAAKRAGESRSGFLARAGIEAAQHAS
ncbi:MAG: type II toxin-antitoxin system HicB family antitoxin [Gallionellaceae bacterium]